MFNVYKFNPRQSINNHYDGTCNDSIMNTNFHILLFKRIASNAGATDREREKEKKIDNCKFCMRVADRRAHKYILYMNEYLKLLPVMYLAIRDTCSALILIGLYFSY